MKDIITELYDMKEAIAREIGEANRRIRQSDDKISMDDLEVIDKLTHSLKSLTTVCAMLEAEEEGYSGEYMQGQSYRGGYSGRENRENRARYNRNSYAREGRNSYGYSRGGDIHERLHQLMNEAPDENTRMEIRKLIDRMER